MEAERLQLIIDAVDRSRGAIGSLRRNIGALADDIRRVNRAMGSLRGDLGTIFGLGGGLTRVFGLFSGAVRLLTGLLGGLIGTVFRLIGGFANLVGGALRLALTLGGTLLGAVTRVAGALGSVLFGAVSRVFGIITKTAIAGVVALGGALAMLARQGISVNQSVQATYMGLSVLLRSGQAASALLAQLRQEAKTSRFEFVDLADYTKRLLAFGFTAREVLPMIRTLGDVAAATGGGRETLQRLIMAFGQIRAKGTMMGEEAMQLTETGIPVRELLGMKRGEDFAKAKMPAEVAIPKLLAGMRARFGGLQQGAAGTLPGAVSNLKDVINELTASITTGLYGSLQKATLALQAFLSNLEKTRAGQVILRTLRALFDQVGKSIEWVATLLPRAAEWLARFLESEQFAKFKKVAWDALMAVLRGIGWVIQRVPQAILLIKDFVDSDRFRQLEAFARKAFDAIRGGAEKSVAWLKENWADAWEKAKNAVVGAVKVIGGTIAGVMSIFALLRGNNKAVVDSFSDMGKGMQRWAAESIRAITLLVEKWAHLGVAISGIAIVLGLLTNNWVLAAKAAAAYTALSYVTAKDAKGQSRIRRGGFAAAREVEALKFGEIGRNLFEEFKETPVGKAFTEGYSEFGEQVDKALEALGKPPAAKPKPKPTPAAPRGRDWAAEQAAHDKAASELRYALPPQLGWPKAPPAPPPARPGGGIPPLSLETVAAQIKYWKEMIEARPQMAAQFTRAGLIPALQQQAALQQRELPKDRTSKAYWEAAAELAETWKKIQEARETVAEAALKVTRQDRETVERATAGVKQEAEHPVGAVAQAVRRDATLVTPKQLERVGGAIEAYQRRVGAVKASEEYRALQSRYDELIRTRTGTQAGERWREQELLSLQAQMGTTLVFNVGSASPEQIGAMVTMKLRELVYQAHGRR